MICPRCGFENRIPEATRYKCAQCGLSLYGEVSPKNLIHTVRRRSLLKLVLLLLVIGAVVYVGFTQHWFGFFGQRLSDTSDSPVSQPLIGRPIVVVKNGDLSASLQEEATWSITATILGTVTYNDDLAALSPLGLLVRWSSSAERRQRSFDVVLQGRSASVVSKDPTLDAATVAQTVGLLHIYPATPEIAALLRKVKAERSVTLDGFLVSGSFNGAMILKAIPAASGDIVPTYSLYLTSLTLGSTTVQVQDGGS